MDKSFKYAYFKDGKKIGVINAAYLCVRYGFDKVELEEEIDEENINENKLQLKK